MSQPTDHPAAPTLPPARKPDPAPRLFTGFLVVAVAALSVLTLRLARENRELKALLSQVRPTADTLKATGPLGPLRLIASDGSASDVTFAGATRPTLLIISAANCSHCTTQRPLWDTLAGEVSQGGGVRVLAIQLDATSDADLRERSTHLAFVRAHQPEQTWLGRVPGTPYTAVVSADGTIRRSWPGEFGADTLPQIRAEIDAALAGG